MFGLFKTIRSRLRRCANHTVTSNYYSHHYPLTDWKLGNIVSNLDLSTIEIRTIAPN